MKISTYFTIQELVPKELYAKWGDKSIWFIQRETLLLADFIRDRFGKAMTINNWHSGGSLNNRGFRMPDAAIGGTLSQHKFGRAIDFNIAGITPQDVYKDIIDHSDMYMKAGATTVEDVAFTNGWTHLDRRWTNKDEILIVKP